MTEETLERRYKLLQEFGADKAAEVEGVKPATIERSAVMHTKLTVPEKDGARILLFDIENAPSESYIWALWKEVTSTAFIKDDWYVMSWSAQWLGDDEITTKALPDYDLYQKEPKNDSVLLQELWSLLDEADILVAHNGKSFDRRKVNARFAIHGILPPSPYKVVDTLLEARKNFMFTSNKLGDLGVYLGLGTKAPTGGFDLWKECIAGNMDSWSLMKEYNSQDVVLLGKVYLRLLPYMTSHPNMGVYQKEEVLACSKCGGTDLKEQGTSRTNVSCFKQYKCESCGAFSRSRKSTLPKSKRDNLLSAIAGQ